MSKFPASDSDSLLHVSVHDVTPETLNKVREILDFLGQRGFVDVTLLVVPGFRWNDQDLECLTKLVNRGYTLAGHGWRHRTDKLNGLGHLLHSLFISRNAAEHLQHDARAICRLISRCHQWFAEHDLGSPELYVPPAWAMGKVSRAQLGQLPFRHYEYLTGFYDVRERRFRHVPLVGFEADSWARFMSLYPLNGLNMLLSRVTRSLRVALHPHDFDLLMGKKLSALFDAGRLGRLGVVTQS